MAPYAQSSDVDFDVSTLWYLPITFVALTAYAALPTFVHKQQLAGIALIARVLWRGREHRLRAGRRG